MALVQSSLVDALDMYIGGVPVPEDLNKIRLTVVSLDNKPTITIADNGDTKEAVALKNANKEERPSEGDNPKNKRKVISKYQVQEKMINAFVFNIRKLQVS